MSNLPPGVNFKFTINIDRYQQARLDAIADSVLLAHTTAVEGDIAEFGIGKGASFEAIAVVLSQIEPRLTGMRCEQKRLYGFDSFKGMPQSTLPGDIDAPMVERNIWSVGKCGSPGVAEIRGKATRWITEDRVQLFDGWFKDTLPLLGANVKFSFVNVDCDLYESTAQVLDFLFSTNRLSDGCILLFDDFLENRCSKKLGQRKAWIECLSKFNPDYTDLGFYGLSGWRCVVHF